MSILSFLTRTKLVILVQADMNQCPLYSCKTLKTIAIKENLLHLGKVKVLKIWFPRTVILTRVSRQDLVTTRGRPHLKIKLLLKIMKKGYISFFRKELFIGSMSGSLRIKLNKDSTFKSNQQRADQVLLHIPLTPKAQTLIISIRLTCP